MLRFRYLIVDSVERIDIAGASQEPFVQDEAQGNPDGRYKGITGLARKHNQVHELRGTSCWVTKGSISWVAKQYEAVILNDHFQVVVLRLKTSSERK